MTNFVLSYKKKVPIDVIRFFDIIKYFPILKHVF